MTIVEFLLARIAEDEEKARAAGGNAWEQDDRSTRRNVVLPTGGYDWVGVAGERLDMPVLTAQISNTARSLFEARAAHIAHHDPARVLAECQAKRAIVAMHKPTTLEDLWGAARPDIAKTLVCEYDSSPDGHLGDTLEWPCTTLRHLAAVYADHPDYQPEWRP